MKLSHIVISAAVILQTAALSAQSVRVIAHRGFWNTAGSAQNSITALRNSADAGVYGSEFDVLMTSDGVLVVNHDDTIAGIDIQGADFSALKDLKLDNAEPLPTLEQYLSEGKKHPQLQMILELKPHRNSSSEAQAVDKVLKMVADMDMQKQVEYISFSLQACRLLLEKSPSAQISYLGSDIAPEQLHRMGFTSLDYYYLSFQKNPQWIRQAKALDMKINVWTVNDLSVMKRLKEAGADYITTDWPLQALELMK